MADDHDPATVMTSFGAPPWAETIDVDEQVIYHCRSVGELSSAETGAIPVEIVQRDKLSIGAGSVTLERHPAHLRVGQSRLSLDEAHELVKLMTRAFEVLDASTAKE